ncbi:MAG TPA: CoA-acylating methylmalonate-semialdehyde dehydrogenase [Gaiellales bacterium]|jgi:malonate-semialdehyde dehydrogenase (acetylating)/methylmalonate-semialdehyde dehydrogenase
MSTHTDTRLLSNYIGGRWVASTASVELDVQNPATGETLARVPLSGAADVDAAVKAARAAFPEWRRRPTIERARWLFGFRQVLEAHADELARSVTREMGKTLPDARAEVGRAIEMVEAASAIPQTMQGRILENVATGVDCETIRQPVGVCAAVVPFNFPAMVPFWFLPFAIACGNTFVLKPSEQVPLTQELVFNLIDEAGGLPDGVVNLVNGSVDVVNGLLDHPGVDAISFVGSAKVARYIYERAAANGKRVQALGGAKNFMVVMPDAVMPKTVSNIIGSAFGAAGQRCMAGSVVVAVGDAKRPLLDELVARTERLSVGDGLEEGIDVGPVVSCAARDRIVEWIERGVEAGATVAVDGRSPGANPEGAFVGPTILDGVTPDMDVAREEIFGPVLSVIHAASLDEAIDIVNASTYGNGTSIFTESGAAVRRYRHDVEVGMVGVNVGVAAPVAFFPFSGWKGSFFGDLHAHGGDAVEFYTRKKTITSRYFSGGETGRFFVEGD